MDIQSFITTTLQKASEIALSYYGQVTGTTKTGDNNQVLTEADLAIGKFIVDSIKQQFPTHNIIDEESGIVKNDSNMTWVVDPIDGTSNFANGVPLFGIMIGLLQNENAIAGGVALPKFSEIYYAEKGKGAWLGEKRLQVTQEVNLLSSLVAYGIDGHQENPDLTREECAFLADLILKIRNIRSSNSVFDTVMLVTGGYGGYLNRTMKIWDVVAVQPIIEEAGGVVTDFSGFPLDYRNALAKKDMNFTICAAPPTLYKKLQEIIHNPRKTTSL